MSPLGMTFFIFSGECSNRLCDLKIVYVRRGICVLYVNMPMCSLNLYRQVSEIMMPQNFVFKQLGNPVILNVYNGKGLKQYTH